MKLLTGIVIGTMAVIFIAEANAVTIQSEPIISSPGSTENLWIYYYAGSVSYISSSADYVQQTDSFRNGLVEQGYVTGEYGNWSDYGSDSFDSDNATDYRSVHVFDTYITSLVDQDVTFRSGGDDGHSVFIDDHFIAGAGYNVTASASVHLVANQEYKLTYIGANYTGPFGWWFNISGQDADGQEWAGPVSAAWQISMNATAGASAPVPEPATLLLFGAGLAGLAGLRRRKNG